MPSVAAARVKLPGALHSLATAAVADASPGSEVGHVDLIRPDAYVALSTRDGDAAPIVAALSSIGVALR